MRNSLKYFALVIVLFTASCSNKTVILEKINSFDLPAYFSSSILLGYDKEQMLKTNHFVIVLGRIDTTNETKPIEIAFIKVNKQLIELHFVKTGLSSSGIYNEFANKDFSLQINFEREPQQNSHCKGEYKLTTKGYSEQEKIYGIGGYY